MLLAVAIVRVVAPDRSRLRRLSIEAVDFPTEPIKSGETIDREKTWTAPDDVYVMGWNARVHALNSHGSLLLYTLPEKVRLFEFRESDGTGRNEFFPPGSAFFLGRGQKIAVRFRLGNSGPDSESQGAVAYIYFVPASGN